MDERSADTGKKQAGRWRRGQSGNPAGRKPGSKNRVLIALDKIGDNAAQDVLLKAVDAAKGGDLRAAEIILSRTWPARKGRPVPIALPPCDTAAGLLAAQSAVTAAVAAGELTPDEAVALSSVLDAQRHAIETADHERRIAALEEQLTNDHP